MNYKVIVDGGSCINAVSSVVLSKVGLKSVIHPHPSKVTWINSTILQVKDMIVVLPMNVDLFILDRTLLFDNDDHNFGRSNMIMLEHINKKIKVLPVHP